MIVSAPAGRALGRGRLRRAAGGAHGRDERGRWSGDVPRLGPGTTTRFSLDGGPPRPDPRSRVAAGRRRRVRRGVVDHGAFRVDRRAAGAAFDLPSAVLYELHVGTFTRRGHLRRRHRPPRPPRRPRRRRGRADAGRRVPRPPGLGLRRRRPVRAAPRLRRARRAASGSSTPATPAGLGVVLDVVYNHLGPAGNHLGRVRARTSPTATARRGATAVNFDGPGSDEVRRFVVDNARMWLRDYHVDGLRLDAVHAIVDDVGRPRPRAAGRGGRRAWPPSSGRPLWLIAESDLNDPRLVRPPRARAATGSTPPGATTSTTPCTPRSPARRAATTRTSARSALLAKALAPGLRLRRRRTRRTGTGAPRPAAGGAARRTSSSCCAQNHDQVGNRARGERLGAPRVARPACASPPRCC